MACCVVDYDGAFPLPGGSIMARIRQRSAAREQFWREMLAEWKTSGLSVRAFCGRHHLAEPTCYYWRQELARRDRGVKARGESAASSMTAPAFVPVRVVAGEPIEVVVRSGQVVRVAAGFDASLLRAVV